MHHLPGYPGRMVDRGVWLDDDQQRAWRAYVGSHARLLAELNRRLVEVSGLTLADYEVLVHLSEASDQRLRSFELADAMQWERSRLTHHLTRMTKRGLVVRELSGAGGFSFAPVLNRCFVGNQALGSEVVFYGCGAVRGESGLATSR